ncbi:MAG: MarR family transcriptional regulator [Acidobacteriota bacterium]|nr:MarR family transcriptional regulator [Acidobacteriota bacterium]
MSRRRADREDPRERLGREAFIATFVTANRFDADSERACRIEELSHGRYSILWVLCRSDDPAGVPMRQLADGLLHRRSDVSRLVDQLHTLGLVTRQPSPEDRRVSLVTPTPQGRKAFEDLTARIKELHRRHWSPLQNHELEQLIHLLNKALWRDEFGTFRELPAAELPESPASDRR